MSSKKEENNSQGDELRCGQCVKPYRDPRLLNCLHSFCMECLQEHVTKNKWKKTLLCPLCQKEMLIPKDGLSAIAKDFYIKARQDLGKLTTTSECDICPDKELAHSRCLNCDVNLCKICKEKHCNPESDQVHHFLEFVEQPVCTQNKPTPSTKLTQMSFCNKHSDQEVNVFCTKCKINICVKCKDDKHKTHAVQETAEMAKSIRGSLTHFLGAIKEYLPEFEDFVKQVRKGQKELDKDLENTIKDIQARSKFLQREIEKIGQQIINEVKEKHKVESDDLNKEAKNIINTYKSIATVAASAERILKIGSDINVIESSKQIQKRFMQVEDELPSLSRDTVATVGFVPGGLKFDSLTKLFGQITKGEIALPTLPVPWGIRVAKEFEMCSIAAFKVKSTADTVQAIAPISDKEAWICCGWGSKDVYLYSITGERKKKVTLDIQVDHMCVTPSGEILVSSYEDKYIRKINKEHVVCDFAMPHLYPGGMVMTKRKELFVCAVDSYTTRRAAHSYRCLMKMSEYGMNIDEIDEDGDTVLFGAPYRISEAPNRELCVTDREEGKLRVIRIDQEGCRKFVYTGPTEVKTKQPFNPLGLCCDRANNLLVSDWGNHCVHMVNGEGEFLGFILSQKDGLFKPNAMALDKTGNLWIGDGNATVRVYKYGKRDY
ncbi:tripartite motif-containing protein 2-like [Ruditapes philippinarum]|uniref:tripartite motif-containing protein 2-like n=1 Tax=Ruditapes philippinarum TaxID=129788 RepID=UPI00295BC3FE|nr:tripartite motif-containing protein 2-like [Ruditapes philippinarum]